HFDRNSRTRICTLSTSEGASNEECVDRALKLSLDVPLIISFFQLELRGLLEEHLLDRLLGHAQTAPEKTCADVGKDFD
ncbi:hypothetical protein EDD85DRAFT_1016589, partial [Armillaria nabsnona]